MIDLKGATLQKLSVHYVGNKEHKERYFQSQEPLRLESELLIDLLQRFFLEPFKNKSEFFNFHHNNDINLNEVYHYVSQIFATRSALHEQSINIAGCLYSRTNHPKIKGGELYVAYFEECVLGDEVVDAVGVFKSENKDNFLQLQESDKKFDVRCDTGVNLSKLDKGCLIFQTHKEDGYKVCIVDSQKGSGSEAQYWKDDFLRLVPAADDYHQTTDYLEFCKEFIVSEAPDASPMDRSEQIDMLNRSLNYFKENDFYEANDFAEQVLQKEELSERFKEYKTQYATARNVALEDDFGINPQAVRKQAKIFKSILKLDKNFHIYIHGDKDWIERGVDEETGRKYYKLFFEDEE